jgi:hypothetical protein
VIHYEIVVLDPEQFTSTVQMLMCCSNAGLQWQTRNRSTVRETNGGLTQLLALEQADGHTGALLSKDIDQTVKSLYAFFSDCVRSLEWCAVESVCRKPVGRCVCGVFF